MYNVQCKNGSLPSMEHRPDLPGKTRDFYIQIGEKKLVA